MNITSKSIVKRVSKLATGVAVCLVLTGCGASQQQPPFGQFPPLQGGQFPPIQQGQFPPVQQGQFPPLQFPPTPGKLNPGQLNPGQFGPVAQVPGGYVNPGVPGWNPLAAGTTQPAGIAQPTAPTGYVPTGQVDASGQPVFQPAAPTAPGTTGVPTAPVSGVPTAPGTTVAAAPTGNVSSTLPRFTNEQLASIQANLAAIKGSSFEGSLTATAGAANYTAYQKYQALQTLAGQVAGALQTSQANSIAQLKNYVAAFEPDQGAQVNAVVADVKALDEAKIKSDLRATHAKITAEMQKQLEAAQVAAAQPATQPAAVQPQLLAGQPQATVPTYNYQGAPAPQYYYNAGGQTQMLYVRSSTGY